VLEAWYVLMCVHVNTDYLQLYPTEELTRKYCELKAIITRLSQDIEDSQIIPQLSLIYYQDFLSP